MPTDKLIRTTDWREERRLRAWKLAQAGWRQKDIAETLGVSKGAVSQWIKRVKENGISDLRRKEAPGAPRRLRDDQTAHLRTLLSENTEQSGLGSETWTYKQVGRPDPARVQCVLFRTARRTLVERGRRWRSGAED